MSTEARKTAWIAERVMGWTVFEDKDGNVFAHTHQTAPDEGWLIYCLHDAGNARCADGIWNPFTSIADAFEVQEAIPEEKRFRYQRALYLEVSAEGVWLNAFQQEWNLIAATPAQRMEAVLAAYGWQE